MIAARAGFIFIKKKEKTDRNEIVIGRRGRGHILFIFPLWIWFIRSPVSISDSFPQQIHPFGCIAESRR